ncbi:hypothetical protein OQA88_11852 [Cercophora sp. LCS_1]
MATYMPPAWATPRTSSRRSANQLPSSSPATLVSAAPTLSARPRARAPVVGSPYLIPINGPSVDRLIRSTNAALTSINERLVPHQPLEIRHQENIRAPDEMPSTQIIEGDEALYAIASWVGDTSEGVILAARYGEYVSRHWQSGDCNEVISYVPTDQDSPSQAARRLRHLRHRVFARAIREGNYEDARFLTETMDDTFLRNMIRDTFPAVLAARPHIRAMLPLQQAEAWSDGFRGRLLRSWRYLDPTTVSRTLGETDINRDGGITRPSGINLGDVLSTMNAQPIMRYGLVALTHFPAENSRPAGNPRSAERTRESYIPPPRMMNLR